MTCMEQGLVQWIDVFMLGVVLGGIAIVIAQFLEKWLQKKLEHNSKKLDVELGKTLLAIQAKLKENMGAKNAPDA